jgi:hypothetical protein
LFKNRRTSQSWSAELVLWFTMVLPHDFSLLSPSSSFST